MMRDERCTPGSHYGCSCDDAEVERLEATIREVWDALGITDYEQAKPHTIAEHVERLRAQAWADKRRREWDADAKSAFLNWERGR
jgi:hypothetical protein